MQSVLMYCGSLCAIFIALFCMICSLLNWCCEAVVQAGAAYSNMDVLEPVLYPELLSEYGDSSPELLLHVLPFDLAESTSQLAWEAPETRCLPPALNSILCCLTAVIPACGVNKGLDSLVALAIRTDNRIGQLRPQWSGRSVLKERPRCYQTPGLSAPRRSPPKQCRHSTSEGEGEPMQLGRARLTQEERRRRQLEGRCFYYGEFGHLVAACPAKRPLVVRPFTASGPDSCTLTTVKVKHHTTTELKALIDSGADESLMDWGLAEEFGLKTELLAKPIKAKALNGK
ncbi:hypothetical protein F2P81_006018 [Scophthalmus maximus]|uniref:Peptidase A2 domain-containing protein n=1 Tax=Scophthalmus maximus TaxID=52904 RepID=A0A6A4T4L9_SCOMX|nr:hypothetical protein F2P81_006018 [Scophthalmus maximus]